MSQNDLSIANQGFASFRSDLNSALQALGSTNSGTSAPSTTYANQLFYDTTNNILKIRNEDNDAFISLFTLDQANDNIESLTINGALSCEGFTSNGIDDNADATAITITSAELVGIGTSPSTRLHVYQATGNTALRVESAEANAQASINFKNDARRYDVGINSSDSFFISDDTASSTRLTINSSGNVGIGLTSLSYSASATQLSVGNTSSNGGINIVSGTSSSGILRFADGTSGDAAYRGRVEYDHSDDSLMFGAGGSERMRIDSSGNVGIGTSSMGSETFVVEKSSGTPTIRINAPSGSEAQLKLQGDGTATDTQLIASKTDASLTFSRWTGSAYEERMRIDSSGNVHVGRTDELSMGANGVTGVNILPGGIIRASVTGDAAGQFARQSSFGEVLRFACAGTGNVGSIDVTTTETSYNTSSDYRLKENVVTDWDATSRLKQLKPSRFNFKIDKDRTLDGFIAHEVSSIVPEAISGEKDAVDKDGNIDPQGIDHSKLVPLMVKTIQELEARIATLEAK